MAKKRDDNLDGQLAFDVNTAGELVLGEKVQMYYQTFFHLITVAGKARQKYCLRQEMERQEGEPKSAEATKAFHQFYKGDINVLKQKLAQDCRVASSKASAFSYYAREVGVPVDLELRKRLFYGLVSDGARLKFFRRRVQKQLSLPVEQREVFSVMDLEHAYMKAQEQRNRDLARAAQAAHDAAEQSAGSVDSAATDPMADAPPVSKKVQTHLKEVAAKHQIDVEAYGDLSKARNVMRVIMDIALGRGRQTGNASATPATAAQATEPL